MTRPSAPRSVLLAAVLCATLAPATLAQASAPPQSSEPSASASVPTSGGAASPLADAAPGEALPAGRYSDASVGRELTFTLDEGWMTAAITGSAGFVLTRHEPNSPYLAITPFLGQVFPAACAKDGDDPEAFMKGVTDIETTAASLVDHIASHPAITAGQPVPIKVAGYEGLQLDISAVKVDEACMPPWAWLWALPEVGDYHLNDGEVARIIAFDADGQVMVAVMEAFPDADLEAFLPEAMAVLDSLEVGPTAG
jgi:hypothetical protein